jgi:hypothetical protein
VCSFASYRICRVYGVKVGQWSGSGEAGAGGVRRPGWACRQNVRLLPLTARNRPKSRLKSASLVTNGHSRQVLTAFAGCNRKSPRPMAQGSTGVTHVATHVFRSRLTYSGRDSCMTYVVGQGACTAGVHTGIWGGHSRRSQSGGWGIRTPEGLHPTRFPSVRHRPLGESSRATDDTGVGRTLGAASRFRWRLPTPVRFTPRRRLQLQEVGFPKPVTLDPDPSCGVTPLNSPRVGRQQGQAGSGGCARGPLLLKVLRCVLRSSKNSTQTCSPCCWDGIGAYGVSSFWPLHNRA